MSLTFVIYDEFAATYQTLATTLEMCLSSVFTPRGIFVGQKLSHLTKDYNSERCSFFFFSKGANRLAFSRVPVDCSDY